MFTVTEYRNGREAVIASPRDAGEAKRAAVEHTALVDAVCAVSRGGGRPFIYAYRGRLVEAAEAIRLLTDAGGVPVLRLDPAPEEDAPAEMVFEPEPEPDDDESDDEPPKRGRRKAGPAETKAAAAERIHKAQPGALLNVDEAEGIIEAIVSVFGIVDDGDDIIHPGAFAKTLAERAGRVKVLNSHNNWDLMAVIGKPMEMREVGREELPAHILTEYPSATGGLWTKTQYLLDTQAGAEVFKRIASEAVSEYSIGFDIVGKADYSKVEVDGQPRTVRNIREIRLWEYSPVVWGMNPATATVAVKSEDGAGGAEQEETQDPAPEAKEYTPDGPQPRLGDNLVADVQSVLTSRLGSYLKDGYIDGDEHTDLMTLVTDVVALMRERLPEDLALRPLPVWSMDWIFFAGHGPNATKVRAAVTDITLSSSGTAHVEDDAQADAVPSRDEEAQAGPPEGQTPTPNEGAGPSVGEAPTDEADLLAHAREALATLEALQ